MAIPELLDSAAHNHFELIFRRIKVGAGAKRIAKIAKQASLAWSGALVDQGNPASLTMSGPLSAGAHFDFVYAVATAVIEFPAATLLDAQLEIENGTAPFTWTLLAGEMPQGLSVSSRGRITGAALETGVFELTFEAVDAIGLPATGTISIDLVEPVIPIEQLAFPFLLVGPLY